VAVFSSDYNRTLETAAPVSKHFNTHINVYDASDLMAFKSKLLSLEGTVIVVGHSNTTPALAELLSNKKVTPMTEVDFRRYFLLDKSLGNKTDGYNVNELTMRF
jgi:broad specificity phosphatase PhoE